MTRVADTSALYALFSEGDAHHERARTDMQDPEPVVVPTEILVETLGLIGVRHGPKAAFRALRDLLAIRHLAVAERVHFGAVRAVYEAHDGRLSLADAFVIQTCRVLAARPLAYDEGILRAVG